MNRQTQTPGKPQHIRPHFAGLIISVACVIALFFLIGGAFALGGSPLSLQKQQRLQKLEQQIAQARTPTRPKNVANLGVPPAQSLVTPQAGITQTHEGPFPASFFLVRSLWQGPLGKNWVLAYAGAKPNPDGTVQQGGILLYTAPRNAPMGSDLHLVGMFLAPTGATALTIVSVSGNLLHVRADSGAVLTFDLQTHQYQP
jgi:hypothetical protein